MWSTECRARRGRVLRADRCLWAGGPMRERRRQLPLLVSARLPAERHRTPVCRHGRVPPGPGLVHHVALPVRLCQPRRRIPLRVSRRLRPLLLLEPLRRYDAAITVGIFGPILWGHSGPLCHALSLLSSSLLLLLMSLWTSMRRRRAAARSGEWAQHFSNASCSINQSINACV